MYDCLLRRSEAAPSRARPAAQAGERRALHLAQEHAAVGLAKLGRVEIHEWEVDRRTHARLPSSSSEPRLDRAGEGTRAARAPVVLPFAPLACSLRPVATPGLPAAW